MLILTYLWFSNIGNGEVEFNEFAIWMSIKMSDTQIKSELSIDLENTFKIFDENGDHYITGKRIKLE